MQYLPNIKATCYWRHYIHICCRTENAYLELIRMCVYLCAVPWNTCTCSTHIPDNSNAWHHNLAVRHCLCYVYVSVTVVPFFWTPHMPVCSVQGTEWQLQGLSWAAGIVPFMVMTDGASWDMRLLQRTGREGWGDCLEWKWMREREKAD